MRAILIVLWGLFCANSWTWCIGMFLPLLMINRWGWWGYLAFAIPNVIGCTAFGYIVKNRQRSETMVRRHAIAMTWFSGITVAFHVFFITYLLSLLFPHSSDPLSNMAAAAALLGLGAVLSFFTNREWLTLTAVVYSTSLAAFFFIGTDGFSHVQWNGSEHSINLVMLLPFTILGFLLCPYLDLTFHRALQQSPSRHSFGIFGVTFSVMILLTIALWFPSGKWDGTSTVVFGLALAHLCAQCVFTVGAHLREMRTSPVFSDAARRWLAMFAPLAAAPLLFFGGLFSDSPQLGEWIYLGFITLYGSIFPAWFVLRARRAFQK